MTKSERQEKALNELADLLEDHWSKLPPTERVAREKAFYDTVSKIETRAKAEGRSASPETRPESGVVHSFDELGLGHSRS